MKLRHIPLALATLAALVGLAVSPISPNPIRVPTKLTLGIDLNRSELIWWGEKLVVDIAEEIEAAAAQLRAAAATTVAETAAATTRSVVLATSSLAARPSTPTTKLTAAELERRAVGLDRVAAKLAAALPKQRDALARVIEVPLRTIVDLVRADPDGEAQFDGVRTAVRADVAPIARRGIERFPKPLDRRIRDDHAPLGAKHRASLVVCSQLQADSNRNQFVGAH